MSEDFSKYTVKGIPCPLIHIQGDTFDMGANEWDEIPIHPVAVHSFYMAQFPVTQSLFEVIMKKNPSNFKGADRPVETVSWDDAQAFVQSLNIETSKTFRLPSEAEWEFAARGGKHAQGYVYCGSDQLKQVGWYRGNSGKETKPVGLLLPNELGLYDMSGNVWEWCEDDYHSDYRKAPKDGSSWIDQPVRGTHRVVHGGSSFYLSTGCRPSDRDNWLPDDRDLVGFRLVLSPYFTSGNDRLAE
jgi:sulfatase modifying factor 1